MPHIGTNRRTTNPATPGQLHEKGNTYKTDKD